MAARKAGIPPLLFTTPMTVNAILDIGDTSCGLRCVCFRAEIVLNPRNQISARLGVFCPVDQHNQKSSRTISHYGRDRNEADKDAVDVIGNQPHDDGPGDHESPILQFESEEFRSS